VSNSLDADPPPHTDGTERGGLTRTPLDLARFVGAENENFLVSLANNRHDLAITMRLQGLYVAAMPHKTLRETDIPIYQLLTFTHYHFLFSTSNLMKCHLSEAFTSVRAAIDGALVAAQIIHDRASQVAYLKREKPFDKLARHYKNLIRDKKPLPHRQIPELLKIHDYCSQFASHADIDSFVHRISTRPDGDEAMFRIEYFQFSRDPDERQMHALNLFHTFVIILDVFADYLIGEKQSVPELWRKTLHELGAKMEEHAAQLRQALAAKSPEVGEEAP
jgi:hypothetical protein